MIYCLMFVFLELSSGSMQKVNLIVLIVVEYLLRRCNPICLEMHGHHVILALKVILLDRLQGINCSVIQEPYLLGFML